MIPSTIQADHYQHFMRNGILISEGVEKMHTPFIEYLAYFNGNHDFFQCHDILEDHWKTIKPMDKKSEYVGLIQLAVALYHHRAGNLVGATKMANNSLKILQQKKVEIQELGINFTKLIEDITLFSARVSDNAPFELFPIVLANPTVEQLAIERTHSLGMIWNCPSIGSEEIIFRHRLRDRSDVISERLRKMHEKNSFQQEN